MNLHEFCESHIGRDREGIFAIQIERVVSYLLQREPGNLGLSLDVCATFRRKGLIPGWLMIDLRDLWEQRYEATEKPTAKGLAISFAACVFPQRAFQMETTQRSMRVAHFLDLFRALQVTEKETVETIREFLTHRVLLNQRLSIEEFDELIEDLSGVRSMHSNDDWRIAGRKKGATLFLATCTPDVAARICEKWMASRETMRTLSCSFYRPPSDCDSQIRATTTAEEFQFASMLENLTHEMARHFKPREIGDHLVQEKVNEFWETQRDKLISGFPFFSFQSNFVTWWKKCLKHWDWEWIEEAIEGTPAAQPEPVVSDEAVARGDEDEQWEVDETALRAWREGYRFIRCTFGRRSAAASPDDLRSALDELWTHRILSGLTGLNKTLRVQEITEHFPSLSKYIINNLSNRLRVRYRVYSQARIKRYSNLAILDHQQQAGKRWSKKSEKEAASGGAEKAASFTVASLARAVPQEFSFLWAFTAHVFLRPKVDRQHADQWTFQRYVRELWHWVNDPGFADLLAHGAGSMRHADLLAQQVLKGGSLLGKLASELMLIENEDLLATYLEQRASLRFEEDAAAALALVSSLIGPNGMAAASDDAMRQWKAMMEPLNGSHWIVPVWYLIFVERLEGDDLLDRLAVDKTEKGPVRRLAQAMRPQSGTAQSGTRGYGL